MAEREAVRLPCLFSFQFVISLSQRLRLVASLTFIAFHAMNIRTRRNNLLEVGAFLRIFPCRVCGRGMGGGGGGGSKKLAFGGGGGTFFLSAYN